MKFKTLAALFASCAFAGMSYGLSWTDTTTTIPLDFLGKTGSHWEKINNQWVQVDDYDNSYAGTFNITDSPGWAPNTVAGATVTFWFADDQPGSAAHPDTGSGSDAQEFVKILVNNTEVVASLQVDGRHATQSELNSNPLAYLNTFASYTFNLSPSQIAALQDGIISFEVQRLSGDTYLKIASLTAWNAPATVPDAGATSALLGLGILSLVALRKRLGAAQ
jgi:hypothetical protein